ncbi:thiol-disulfide oxidoreductase ResA [Longirhabdus pacifica]|uniref:thiol-disulfide oxidoreductase ResA n=1 Tax=Longirhabdus pacifica TaxID=2305227 RepID=UPI001008A2FA|nr:thiol-disulfide oxidoreductase ResA [Longirhabdus pacifica]
MSQSNNVKQKRLILRTVILAVFIIVLGYTIYSNVFKNPAPVQVGDIAPDFELQTTNGETVKLSDYRGKGVFLNFWSTYCEGCEIEMPYMDSQYQFFKDKGVEVLAVDVGEPALTVKKFAEKYNLTFPVLLDEKQEVTKRYGVLPIPATFIIDKDGVVLDYIEGSLPEQSIRVLMSKIVP